MSLGHKKPRNFHLICWDIGAEALNKHVRNLIIMGPPRCEEVQVLWRRHNKCFDKFLTWSFPSPDTNAGMVKPSLIPVLTVLPPQP